MFLLYFMLILFGVIWAKKVKWSEITSSEVLLFGIMFFTYCIAVKPN
ncbi:hypothetical protein VP249E411_P0211 [Vibrio phage 249E41-1]|nr:hypothetical protein VP249E411_P0211 [Vibrio phage 249E41-1]CAH9014493.1 hypothetical protein VP277E431_P0209 [Vibrio phage 277E43-1]